MQKVSTPQELAKLDFAEQAKESAAFALKLLRFGYETAAVACGRLTTATGRALTHVGNQVAAAALHLKQSNKVAAQLAIAETFNQQFNFALARQNIQRAWDAVRSSAETVDSRAGEVRITHLQRDFIVSTEYISAEVETALQERIEMDWEAANSIADGTFIGPQLPHIQSLVDEFANAEISRNELRDELLLDRGILFSKELDAPVFERKRLETIRSEFDQVGSSQTCPVLVFRDAAQGAQYEVTRTPHATTCLSPVTPHA